MFTLRFENLVRLFSVATSYRNLPFATQKLRATVNGFVSQSKQKPVHELRIEKCTCSGFTVSTYLTGVDWVVRGEIGYNLGFNVFNYHAVVVLNQMLAHVGEIHELCFIRVFCNCLKPSHL